MLADDARTTCGRHRNKWLWKSLHLFVSFNTTTRFMAWGGVPCDNYPWYLQPHHTGTPRMGPQPPTQGYPPFLYRPFASRGGPHPDGVGCLHPGEGGLHGELNLYPEGGCIQRGWGALCLGGGESVSRAGRGLYPGGGGDLYPGGIGKGSLPTGEGADYLPPPP